MKKLLVGILLLFPLIASADWYGIIGAGQTKYPTYYGRGQWQQVDAGFAFAAEEQSPAWSLGIGRRLNRDLAVEVAYSDLGTYSSFGRYTSDASFNAGCKPPQCDPTATGWHHGQTRTLEVSALRQWWHLFGRLGFGYHDTTFIVHMSADSGNTQGRAVNVYDRDNGLFGDRDFHGVMGVGIRFAPILLEYQYRPGIGDGGGGYHEARTVLLSAELAF